MKNPLVSVIIPTLNSEKYLAACLQSVKKQTYKPIEIIVVDNFSTDGTVSLAKRFTKNVFVHGDERSPQRNYGVKKAKGTYVFFVDGDFILEKDVVFSCVRSMQNDKIEGVAVPLRGIGLGFWTKCKILERDLNLKAYWLDAARFFKRSDVNAVGGYDEKLVSGDDWDLSQRICRSGKIKRISAFMEHNEGTLSLRKIIRKNFYYGRKIGNYTKKEINEKQKKTQGSIIQRYALYLSQRDKLFAEPIVGLGLLFMKTCEFGSAGFGFIVNRINMRSN